LPEFLETEKSIGAIVMANAQNASGLSRSVFTRRPFRIANSLMTTTHKTLRGPRGGLILCRDEFAKHINKAVFWRSGGPHIIGESCRVRREALR